MTQVPFAAIADDPGRYPTPLREARPGVLTMNKDHERGEKRGVLDTGRARKLGKDADADADDDDDENED